jgi:hypothetical protein
MAFHEAVQQLFLTHRTDAARHALTASFVAEEFRDAEKDFGQVDGVIEKHDNTGAERSAYRARAGEGQRRIEFARRDERARRTAKQNSL